MGGGGRDRQREKEKVVLFLSSRVGLNFTSPPRRAASSKARRKKRPRCCGKVANLCTENNKAQGLRNFKIVFMLTTKDFWIIVSCG